MILGEINFSYYGDLLLQQRQRKEKQKVKYANARSFRSETWCVGYVINNEKLKSKIIAMNTCRIGDGICVFIRLRIFKFCN